MKKRSKQYMKDVNWHIRCAVKEGWLCEDRAEKMTDKEKINYYLKSE